MERRNLQSPVIHARTGKRVWRQSKMYDTFHAAIGGTRTTGRYVHLQTGLRSGDYMVEH